MSNEITAVILCAGKGSRMNDDSKNKVCFECAGIPVIKRIINNMRQGGVTRFVLVVGHQAQSVMECLAGEPGVAYAFQKEQKGTGHAARCGLEVLEKLGGEGRALVVMGDKIIAPHVITSIIKEAETAEAIWGVQPSSVNWSGGRVVVDGGKPYGVVEWADVGYQALAGQPREKWQDILTAMKLNAKKAAKVIEKAEKNPPAGYVHLNGRDFDAAFLQKVPYSNASLYCFDVRSVLAALENCQANNAQGEIYLTDTLETFAAKGQAKILEIPRHEDMLTFSTKTELRAISPYFLETAEEITSLLYWDKWQKRLQEIYGYDAVQAQTERYADLLKKFQDKFGNRKVMITRAPGRINMMGRHIDHRGGYNNVMTIDRDVLMVVSPRNDDKVHVSNIDSSLFPDAEFSISECLAPATGTADWLEYLEKPEVIQQLNETRGHWVNYVKSAVLRYQRNCDFPLCGMDILATGNIPIAAGLSSSSAIVVATAEAICGLNCLNLTSKTFIELCGEGEWFVGSRGGAGDHAAMKCGRKGAITQMKFKPFAVGETLPFADEYAVVVASSCQQAKKSEGSKDIFNARIASYECAFMLLQTLYPQRGWREFRELAEIVPENELYSLLKQLPEHATRKELYKLLPRQKERLDKIFASHSDPGEYDLRGVTLYGASECARAKYFGELLENKDYASVGEMMKISQNGDRICKNDFSDAALDELITNNIPLWRTSGAYACSTTRIDEMCDLLNETPGVMGSCLVGAGLGGCVIALVKTQLAQDVIKTLNKKYYDKYALPYSANTYRPGEGSMIL